MSEWQPIENLTRGIKGEVLFIQRIAGDSAIEDTFAGTYCGHDLHREEWFDTFVNPSAGVQDFKYVKRYYTHFMVFTDPEATP